MYDIFVNVLPPTEAGRIHYFHDPDIYNDILFITSAQSSLIKININFQGGEAIIDFDKNRLLKDVECVLPRFAWKQSQTICVPKPERSGDIEFVYVRNELGQIVRARSSRRNKSFFYYYNEDEDTRVESLRTIPFPLPGFFLETKTKSAIGWAYRINARPWSGTKSCWGFRSSWPTPLCASTATWLIQRQSPTKLEKLLHHRSDQ